MVIEQPSHSCKLCGKTFWNRDSMYKHMNMHKGTTQCPVCHKVLSRTTHMKRHLKNRHGWMGIATASGTPILTTSNPTGVVNTVVNQRQQQTAVNQNPVNTTTGLQLQPTPSPTFTTIRIRESSVERITSSPIP